MAMESVVNVGVGIAAAAARRVPAGGGRVRPPSRGGFAFLSMPSAPQGVAAGLKRLTDLGVGGSLILTLAPAMLVIALIIRLKSPGPILVRQERFGRDLRPFSMLKFRSMVDGAESMLGELSHLNEAGGPLFKIRKDPRLTPVGAVLRRFSLDELPQLVNVLRGEMSLVGPRPPLPPEVEADYLRQRTRLRFPPGMTGLWQVSGRSELRYEAMIGLDYTYMRGWSPLQDIRILLRTVPAVISGKGAC